MEPQIIDYYNEMPYSVNVIDKMNEEFSILQKENDELKIENDILKKDNDILKDDLCMNKEYGRPKVEYKNEEELNNIKEEAYRQLKIDIYNFKEVDEWVIKNVLYKLVPNESEAKIRSILGKKYEHPESTNWVHRKSCDILKYVNYSFNSLINLNVEPDQIYENLYDIITNEIDSLMYIGGNIVQYRCIECGQLTDYIDKSTFGDNKCIACFVNELGN